MPFTVAFDAGTSGSKVIASYRSSEYPFERVENYFLIDPSVRLLTEPTYQDKLEYANEQEGLSSNLVSYVDPESGQRTYWEVGESASLSGLLSVRERKFENLLTKLLSFLGYLVCCEMTPEKIAELTLGILLPYDEIADRRLLTRWVKQILGKVGEDSPPGFEFNGIKVNNIRIKAIDCKPEGYGISKTSKSDLVAVLVVGHSDSSWLYFNRGMLNTEYSRTLPGTGMHSFIRSLKFPITDELRAAKILAQAGSNLKSDVLAQLTQTKTEAEMTLLQQAIAQAKQQYWSDRRRQIQSLETEGVTKVLATGGFASYSSRELEELFKDLFGLRLYWCKKLMLEFYERFEVKRKDLLLYRFGDNYGYYRTLPGVASAPGRQKTGAVAHG